MHEDFLPDIELAPFLTGLFPSLISGAMAAIFGATPAYARGVCYADCSSNGVALLVVAPLVFIYFKFWNKRKGAPRLGQCLVYIFLAALISFVVGYATLTFLVVPLWAAWILMTCILLATFTFLIHPSRHAANC